MLDGTQFPDAVSSSAILHTCNENPRVRIRVSGRTFECYKKTLLSKKGSIFAEEEKVKPFYCEKTQAYVFYRSYHVFEAILVYLQCGILTKPEKVSFKCFIEELVFFGFREVAHKLYEDESRLDSVSLVTVAAKEEDKKKSTTMKTDLRLYLYEILERPEKNTASQIFSLLATIIIVLSIIVYCSSTYPGQSGTARQHMDDIETGCNVWFTLEITMRFLLCPKKKRFCKNLMNIIDLLAILPFYIELIAEGNDDAAVLAMFRVLRVTRVFRVLKISRYSVGMQVVILTVKESLKELSILLFFIFMIMVFFSSLIYQFELENNTHENKFKSIPHSFWLVIVTITTVGYGDLVPVTLGGKLITSFLSVTGIILIALPIPIVVNNFRTIYEHMVERPEEYFFDFEELCKRALATSPALQNDKRDIQEEVLENES